MAAAAVMLLVPAGAFALGLGEARVESYLNQPLDVRMRLLEASADDLDTLTVALAGPDDFERLGLSSQALALDLSVEIDRSQSPPIIRVTSDRAVTDPVVQLLLDARWSSGRLLREYTLFLDPATVDIAPPPVETTRREPAEPAPPTTAEPEPERTARPSTPAQRPRAVARQGDRYGPVASGETLWSIAQANRPAADVTMDQTMIAIVELNPSAFRDGNINRLLRGAELELPDAQRARALDPAEAAAAVAAQNRAFRQAAADTPVVSDAGRDVENQTDAETGVDRTADAGSDAPEAQPRLSLVPPGDEEQGAGAGSDDNQVRNLRQQLARAEEELYAARQEAEEFRSRVDDLEALVRDNPGGFGLQDAELAGLEETLRAAREATREGADPELRAEVSERLSDYLDQYVDTGTASGESAAESDPRESDQDDRDMRDGEAAAAEAGAGGSDDEQVADASGAADEADESEAEPGAAESEAAAQAESESVPAESPRRVTEVGSGGGLFSNPMTWLVIALVVLLVVALGLRMGLRRRREEAEARSQPLKRADDLPAPPKSDSDPVDDARAAVTRQPEDLSAHLALLRTLASEGREEEFGAALEAMFEHVSSGEEPEWREAVELAGRVVPGHALVKGSADWVADSREESDSDEATSEIDQESEVDDLMSRLDADLDEDDDADWLESEPEPEQREADRGPLLREDEDASADVSGDSVSPDREESVNFEPEPEDRPKGEAETDDEEDLAIDWPDAESTESDDRISSGSASEASEPAEAEADEDEDEDEDIFSQTDDDIDVKLDLAKAYLSWDSADSARTLLEEVEKEGNEAQREQARKLLDDLDGGSED
jgi:pilus assembly protein FimV